MQSVPQGLAAHHGDTVYVAAVDGEGNACSLINSIYDSFGSGLVVPGTGIALHNRGASFSLDPSHPNALAPRKRPFHTLVPGMATRDGELWLTYGVMGTMQQAQGHFQVLVNMIDFGLDPQAALDAPRFRTSLDEGPMSRTWPRTKLRRSCGEEDTTSRSAHPTPSSSAAGRLSSAAPTPGP